MTSVHEDTGSIPDLAQRVKDLALSGMGHRHSSDLTLLWLWRRPAATAPIRPLAWEFPYATSSALKRQKKKKKKTHLLYRKSYGLHCAMFGHHRLRLGMGGFAGLH